MSQLDLANKIGINKKNVNKIIQGKASITSLMALKLEYVFNIPASFWNNLESNYRGFLKKNNVVSKVIVGRLQKDGIIKWNQFNELIICI